MIRALGLLLGLLMVALPLLHSSSYVDAARSNPKLFMAPFLGILFVAYGLGGTRLLSRWAPRLTKPVGSGIRKSIGSSPPPQVAVARRHSSALA
jgi:hypothetical protein